jgi:hypothetical protein
MINLQGCSLAPDGARLATFKEYNMSSRDIFSSVYFLTDLLPFDNSKRVFAIPFHLLVT